MQQPAKIERVRAAERETRGITSSKNIAPLSHLSEPLYIICCQWFIERSANATRRGSSTHTVLKRIRKDRKKKEKNNGMMSLSVAVAPFPLPYKQGLPSDQPAAADVTTPRACRTTNRAINRATRTRFHAGGASCACIRNKMSAIAPPGSQPAVARRRGGVPRFPRR